MLFIPAVIRFLVAGNAALGMEVHGRGNVRRVGIHQTLAESDVWRSCKRVSVTFVNSWRPGIGTTNCVCGAVAGSFRREQRSLEPVDKLLLSGEPKLAANVRVADAPEIFRMKRHDPAAFRARGRHGGNQADPGAC